jgi:6,7-dimethyl-8-ribityllumazine synthase
VKTGRRQRRSNTSGEGNRFAIVVSRFNVSITKKLLDGAVACLARHGVRERHVKVFPCPGAFELPQVANALCASGAWDAVICLGAVIRGETPHFEYVAAESARGIQEAALRHGIPVTFGVLTTETVQQARERAGGRHGNKGWDAALAAIEMVDVFARLQKAGKSISKKKQSGDVRTR